MWPFQKSKFILPELPELGSTSSLDEPPRPTLDLPSFSAKRRRAKIETLLPEGESVNIASINLWLANGVVVKDLEDLREALLAMNDATFHYHVNVERNDIASWVQDVLGNNELAMKLKNVHKRKDFLNILEKETHHLVEAVPQKKERRAVPSGPEMQKYAYMGLRGMASGLESETPLAQKKRYEVKQDTHSAAMALSELDSMQDITRLISKLSPKGTMLKEHLAKEKNVPNTEVKKEKPTAEVKEVEHLFLPKTVPQLDLPDYSRQNEINSAISKAKVPVKIESVKVVPKKQTAKSQKQAKDVILQRIEEAENADLKTARGLLKEAKVLAKQMKLDKKFKYDFWEAENKIKLRSA